MSMLKAPVGFVAFGHALPERVRFNDDAAYQSLVSDDPERQLFWGTEERRVLGEDERVEGLMTQACREALDKAGVAPEEVDALYGYASVSEYMTPNGLFQVHRDVGLRSDIVVAPINCEFTNFITAAVMARDAILAGRCKYVLIACGTSWTRCVDRHRGHALVVGDGAGAVLVGPSEEFVILDHATCIRSDLFDAMTLKVRVTPGEGSGNDLSPTYSISELGRETFLGAGHTIPPQLVHQMLRKHGVPADALTLVTHESSRRLSEAWELAIGPSQYLRNLETLGDMPLSSILITMARRQSEIINPYVAFVSPGTGTHFSAMLVANRPGATSRGA